MLHRIRIQILPTLFVKLDESLEAGCLGDWLLDLKSPSTLHCFQPCQMLSAPPNQISSSNLLSVEKYPCEMTIEMNQRQFCATQLIMFLGTG